MGKFKKGIFLGGLLGASMMWMNTTKKGKQVKEKLLDQAADVYLDVKDKVVASGTYDKMTKQEFVVMAREAVNKYAIKNPLAAKARNNVVKLVGAQWSQLKKEMHKNCKCDGKGKSKKSSCCKSKKKK